MGLAGVAGTREVALAHLLERLHYKVSYTDSKRYRHLVENRSGIIAVEPSAAGDIIYGGGVYDGRFNLDPVSNSNGIRRAYLIAALHPDPQDVLEVGLSSGSWSRVLADHERVRRLTIFEINPTTGKPGGLVGSVSGGLVLRTGHLDALLRGLTGALP